MINKLFATNCKLFAIFCKPFAIQNLKAREIRRSQNNAIVAAVNRRRLLRIQLLLLLILLRRYRQTNKRRRRFWVRPIFQEKERYSAANTIIFCENWNFTTENSSSGIWRYKHIVCYYVCFVCLAHRLTCLYVVMCTTLHYIENPQPQV